MKRYLVAGAGFSGAVIARALAEAGLQVLVAEEKPHPGGHCHTERHAVTGVMVHRYGAHIFHTGNDAVWDYVCRFAEMMPYQHRVRVTARGRVHSFPINLLTLNQLWGTSFTPAEARAHLEGLREPCEAPENFEEQALALVGRDIYETFFRGYTEKQWGVDATRLPASILTRLPLRLSYDDTYFHHPRQGIPRDGYTALVAAILDHPGIELRLGCAAETLTEEFAHLFWTGPIDRYFGHRLGWLRYRSLRFEEMVAEGDIQGVPVMNHTDADVPYTRIIEHRWFAPWEMDGFSHSVAHVEYPMPCGPGDTPFYPVRLVDDQAMLRDYARLAEASGGVSFLGRLATYAYIDMDAAIERAMEMAEAALAAIRDGRAPPVFSRPVV